MIKLLMVVLCPILLNGCVLGIGYPSWQYRCYNVDVEPGISVPPMPDCSENNKTLGGIDSDNDGVRDDIQRYIVSIENTSPFHKRALQQLAKVQRNAVIESADSSRAQLNFTKVNLATDCAWSASVDQMFSYTDLISNLNRNTFKRRIADRSSRSTLEIQLIPSVKSKDACDFDVNKYEGERWK